MDHILADRLDWATDEDGNRTGSSVVESDLLIRADLVLLAIGFRGPRAGPFRELGIEVDDRGRFVVDQDLMTSAEGIFAAGDAHLGPSLVVWAIAEGRDVARSIDRFLTGRTSLPPSARSANAAFALRSAL